MDEFYTSSERVNKCKKILTFIFNIFKNFFPSWDTEDIKHYMLLSF